jgi:Ca-activated chloride channel family protein
MVSFIWPQALVLLVLIPAGVGLYLALDARRRRRTGSSSGLGFAGRGARRPGQLRTLVPAGLILAGLVVMTLALARPQGVIALPREEGTIILAYDVSGSMAADDLKPTRMDAAKAATKAFVERQPAGVVIGVVAFSDGGLSVQAPTSDQNAVLSAIDRLTPQKGTSVGQGILTSLKAIQIAQSGPQIDYYSNRTPDATPAPTPVPAGTHTSAAIVLLTDGENNESPDPIAVAHIAADQGVRIYTVGIGSEAGTTLDLNGFRVHTQLDAATLQQISAVTEGTYYSADNTQDLNAIYGSLDTQLVTKPERIEITAVLAGFAVLLLAAGALGSLAWLGRLP